MPAQPSSSTSLFVSFFIVICIVLFFAAVAIESIFSTGIDVISHSVLVGISTLLSLQSMFTIYWMVYHWEDASHKKNSGIPEKIEQPKKTFSLLIPARHEAVVIADTIRSISELHYPQDLYEAIILCKHDDRETSSIAEETIAILNLKNVRVHSFSSVHTDKPTALNIGLEQAQHEIVAVFDAEDRPKPEILNVVNSIYVQENPDVVQGGVQLMNYGSTWFSVHNVLEYYFWFKSALHLFSKLGVIPLGGNTVFFKKEALLAGGGWKRCLTEDADVGLRLSAQGKKIRVLYDPSLVTEEETPASTGAFLKQRSRWNQGFLQIVMSGIWTKVPGIRRKIVALYILSLPIMSAANLIFAAISPITLLIKLPLVATLVILFPMFLLGLHTLIQTIGFWEFTRDFRYPAQWYMFIVVILTSIPYQTLLSIAAWRAVVRQLFGFKAWEKTAHYNLHQTYA